MNFDFGNGLIAIRNPQEIVIEHDVGFGPPFRWKLDQDAVLKLIAWLKGE